MQADAIAAKDHAITHVCMRKNWMTSHDSEVYCTKCYQNEVVQAKDVSVTFAELLKSTLALHPERRAISIATDCKKFVDNFILQSNLTMTVDKFYAWEKEKELLYSKKPKRMVEPNGVCSFAKKHDTWHRKILMILLLIWHSKNMHLALMGL